MTRFVTINGKNVTSTLAKFLVIIGVNFAIIGVILAIIGVIFSFTPHFQVTILNPKTTSPHNTIYINNPLVKNFSVVATNLTL